MWTMLGMVLEDMARAEQAGAGVGGPIASVDR